MAEIIFIQNLPYEYAGIASISALLKKYGHKVKVVIVSNLRSVENIFNSRQIVAFSVMTGTQQWTLDLAEKIKNKFGAFIIIGGPHPTYYPEVIENPQIDAICRGEGELAMLDLANSYDKNGDIAKISNLWIKNKGIIYKNDVRQLTDDLNFFPDQDREIYYSEYEFMRDNSHKTFIAGRGCPFDCSFCFNKQLRQLYRNKGNFIRMRSPERVINEIEKVKNAYKLKKVFFHDDTFILNEEWLNDFLNLYEKKIKLPFYCTGRADTITEDIAKKLKSANCVVVSFAVESGNEMTRKKILKKGISNFKLIEAARILKSHNIKIATYNIFGIPGETINDAWDTVKINIEMNVDYPRCSFLTPYPGLEITEYAKERGYLDTTVDHISAFSQQTRSLIKNSDMNKLINIHHFFQTLVLWPKSIFIIKFLINLPANFIFRAWWALLYFFIFTLSEGRNICNMLRFSIGMWLLSFSKMLSILSARRKPNIDN